MVIVPKLDLVIVRLGDTLRIDQAILAGDGLEDMPYASPHEDLRI